MGKYCDLYFLFRPTISSWLTGRDTESKGFHGPGFETWFDGSNRGVGVCGGRESPATTGYRLRASTTFSPTLILNSFFLIKNIKLKITTATILLSKRDNKYR